jgi:hypothetical protein
MSSFDDLEARLQSLLEVQLLKYLPGYKPEDMLYQQLATAMHGSLKIQDGITYAPNVFSIISNPATLARWYSAPALISELAGALQVAGDEAGFIFLARPSVTTAVDDNITSGAFQIKASFSSEDLAETQGLRVGHDPAGSLKNFPSNAFLILGGTKTIPLDLPVINIGRRLDNQVVIDDPRVSRTHAQLRVSRNRFMLFDLNSSGGTFVNGQRIDQSILYPGDVISLAGVTLIFGQDLPAGNIADRGGTEPKPAVSPERTTDGKSQPGSGKPKKAGKL